MSSRVLSFLKEHPRHGECLQKMMSEYPEHILPRACYRKRMDPEELNQPRVYLQRKCYADRSECCENNDPDRVTTAAFGRTGLHHMSVNLLGGLFGPGDELWYQDVGEEDIWNGGDVELSTYSAKYREDPIQASVYFQFNKAHNLTWTFPRSFDSQKQHDRYADAIVSGMSGSFSKDQSYDLRCSAKCEHSPSVLNYWHFEVVGKIDSVPAEEIYGKNSSQKRAMRMMIEALRPFSTLSYPTDCLSLPENFYTGGT